MPKTHKKIFSLSLIFILFTVGLVAVYTNVTAMDRHGIHLINGGGGGGSTPTSTRTPTQTQTPTPTPASSGGWGSCSCSWSDWTNQGCGLGSCDLDKMLQEKYYTCTPANCKTHKKQTRCVTDSSCAVRTLYIHLTGSGAGTVTSSPSGIYCGSRGINRDAFECTASFTPGTIVTLTATADDVFPKPPSGCGSFFQRWGGSCSGASTNCIVLMTKDRVATAIFEPRRCEEKNGSGQDLSASCSAYPASVRRGQTVTFEADAQGGTRVYRYSWSLACGGTERICFKVFDDDDRFGTYYADVTVTSGNQKVTVRCGVELVCDQFKLETSSTLGGSVTVPGEGTFSYCKGDAISLLATPASGYLFSHWSGNATGTSRSTSITMDSDKSVMANFTPPPTTPPPTTPPPTTPPPTTPPPCDCEWSEWEPALSDEAGCGADPCTTAKDHGQTRTCECEPSSCSPTCVGESGRCSPDHATCDEGGPCIFPCPNP